MITQYTRAYSQAMRISSILQKNYGHLSVRPVVDLDAVATTMDEAEVESVSAMKEYHIMWAAGIALSGLGACPERGSFRVVRDVWRATFR